MIQFKQVKYQYEQQAFEFDFKIKQGSTLAIIGASGVGKSTLLSLLAGFICPNQGDILINEQSIIMLSPDKRPLSILFQEHNLFNHLSVYDNIALGLNPKLKLNTAQKKRVTQVSQQVEITSLLSRLPTQLSGGQKQRVALARCFAQNRNILLLDEPFSALDPVLRSGMLKQISDLENITTLMVTHHLKDALQVASHFIFIDAGKALQVEPIQNLTTKNNNEKLCEFVKAAL